MGPKDGVRHKKERAITKSDIIQVLLCSLKQPEPFNRIQSSSYEALLEKPKMMGFRLLITIITVGIKSGELD